MRDLGRLTVAIVSTQAQWHGGEEQVRLLAQGLRERGHRPVIFARRGGVLALHMAAEGYDVTDFVGSGRSFAAIWTIRRALRKLVRQSAAGETPAPLVWHANDAHALTAAGLASIGLRIPARIASRRLDFPVRSPRRYRALCDRLICVSQRVAEVCRQTGIPARMLRVVHDGVDPQRVRQGDRCDGRRSLGVGDADRVLLTVAKLTDHKGHRFLLDAMPAVIAQHPEVQLFLAGDGELIEPLRQQAGRLGIDRAVRFLGFRDDVPDLIRAADLFVFPSHMEGMGSTLVDAMLAGLPIVTTTAGGIPDVTGAGQPGVAQTAWTVPPRNSEALTAAILDALRSPDKCALLRTRAQQRAEEQYTAAHMVDATLEVYRDVLR
jgi:glycosyltransferase involved in cell wall biosynthesis